jgi:glucose-1-phosphate thymidylyltransferase
MDCGNKQVTVETNSRMLKFIHEDQKEQLISSSVKIVNSEIIEPCFIGENVFLKNAKIGPNVSIGNGTMIDNSSIKNSLIQENSQVLNAKLDKAMIGNFAKFDGNFTSVSIGDYSVLD